MDCDEWEKQVSRMIDCEPGRRAPEAVRQHLAGCMRCRNMHGRMQALTETLRSVSLYAAPATLAPKVKARLAEENAQRLGLRRHFSFGWSRTPLLAMIVLMAIGLGSFAGSSMTEILVSHGSEGKIEYLLTEPGRSFLDVVLEITVEENSR